MPLAPTSPNVGSAPAFLRASGPLRLLFPPPTQLRPVRFNEKPRPLGILPDPSILEGGLFHTLVTPRPRSD